MMNGELYMCGSQLKDHFFSSCKYKHSPEVKHDENFPDVAKQCSQLLKADETDSIEDLIWQR